MQRCITALFICATLSLSHLAFGQASVNENLETAFSMWMEPVGSDSNSGTQSKPLKTIGAAASMAQSNNQAGIGSRVIINPGTYARAFRSSTTTRTLPFPIVVSSGNQRDRHDQRAESCTPAGRRTGQRQHLHQRLAQRLG